MVRKQAVLGLLLLCGVVGLSGCASRPPAATLEQLSKADLAVKQADKSKAPEYASGELYTAREQLASAQQALNRKDYAEARRLAERALVNAQLAESMAVAAQPRQAATELQNSVQDLRREVDQQAVRSR
jgi:chromosome segregation ATPase